MSEIKVCFRCKQPIDIANDSYFKFVEVANAKEVRTDYAHKSCWNEFLNNIGSVKQATGMLSQLQGKLTEMGLLKPQEVVLA